MVQNQSKQRNLHLPELESVNRISNLPIVESSWYYAGQIYNRVKNSNNILTWTFDHAETSIYNVLDNAAPAVFLLEGPLTRIDRIICRSLDIVEQTVPSINLPPQMIYSNTKQYVSDVGTKLVRPVLKRADSVKQIGNSVLSNKYAAFAADKLDGALDVADKYVDKYLPADVFDNPGNDDDATKSVDGPAGKAIQTSKHMYRFSKKLQRRLTRRTLLEAKALKEQSAEAIHVLVYVAELIATDPKMALLKGKELWGSLSKDEPENQARPENLEQLIVLLTRETARRLVHLVNFTANRIGRVPIKVNKLINTVTASCLHLVDTVLKSVRLDGVRQAVVGGAGNCASSISAVVKNLNIRITDLLEQLAKMLAQNQQNQQNQQKQPPAVTSISVTNSTPIPLPPPPAKQPATKPIKQQFQISPQQQQQDTLRPPVATRTQLKATHRNVNAVSNGESIVKT